MKFYFINVRESTLSLSLSLSLSPNFLQWKSHSKRVKIQPQPSKKWKYFTSWKRMTIFTLINMNFHFEEVKSHCKKMRFHFLEIKIYSKKNKKLFFSLFQEVKGGCIFTFLEWDFTARNLKCITYYNLRLFHH